MSINLHVMKGILANFARSGILAPETIISHDTGREQAHWGPGHWGNAKYWEPLAPDPFFWYNCTTYESDRRGASVTNTCGRADIEVTDPQLCEHQRDTAAWSQMISDCASSTSSWKYFGPKYIPLPPTWEIKTHNFPKTSIIFIFLKLAFLKL